MAHYIIDSDVIDAMTMAFSNYSIEELAASNHGYYSWLVERMLGKCR